jgi:hypothetical protein
MDLWEVSLFEFVRVTVILGGGAAWLDRPRHGPHLVAVVAARLLRRASHRSRSASSTSACSKELSSCRPGIFRLHYYAGVDFVVLMIAAIIGRKVTRSRQMARQYGFSAGGPRQQSRVEYEA